MANEIKINSRLTPLFEYLKKQQENRKFVQTVELAGTFILITFFLIFAIRPTALTISALVGEIKSKEILSKEMKSKINQVIAAQDVFSTVQERYSLVDSSLPSRPRFAQAAAQVSALSLSQGLPLEKIDFSLTEDKYYTSSISTSSSFINSVSLVSRLLDSRRLIDVPSISFSVGKDDGPTKTVAVKIPLNIYYWPEITNEKK